MRLSFVFTNLLLLGLASSLPAESVHVEQVEGEVLYGAGNATPTMPVRAGQDLGPGIFSAGGNGVLYLSAFPNSNLRLAETGTLRFLSESGRTSAAPAPLPSSFRLQQGKLLVTVRDPGRPAHAYRVVFERGSALMGAGQCVMCMHGEGTYIYVARGHVSLEPATPHTPSSVQTLSANGSIGVLEKDGTIRVRPLSAVAPSTQNCLLAGFQPDSGGSGIGSGNRVDASGGPIVSPTQ